MNDSITAILKKHEADDDAQIGESALMVAAIKREFFNSEEILKVAAEKHITVGDLVSGRVKEFPIIPVRQSEEFYLKKHTKSQFPYAHSHRFYELIYVHKGECVQKFARGGELRLTEKQCALVFPNTVHSLGECGPKDVILKMVIPCGLFERTCASAFGDFVTGPVQVFETVSETAEYAVLQLLEEQYRNNLFKDFITQSYLTILFAELVGSPKTDLAWETALCRYFGENIKTASLKEFAAMHHYHPDYASRLIKQRTGKSFSELLIRYRMNRVKDLLIESSLSVEDIAFEVGYANSTGLYKQFFAAFGMKPSQYRNLFR